MSILPDYMRSVSKHTFTPLVRGFAGNRLLALVRHVGRHSGRTYTTPVMVRKVGDTFLIAVVYGLTTDWCRNVLEAGTCDIQLQGRWYRAVEPRIVSRPIALGSFNVLQRTLLHIIGVEHYLRLHAAS